MINEFSRLELLVGETAMKKLQNARVAVFGIGGVGGHCAEALVRSGIASLDFFDNDVVSISNINRQIVAVHSTIGKEKTEVMKERALDINPNAKINAVNIFLTAENANEIDFDKFDYIVDAIDTISSKILLAKIADEKKIPIISSMGAGNKLNPVGFMVADINKTEVCPLARVMRKKLKDNGIKKLKVVYSKEIPLTPRKSDEKKGTANRPTPGSSAFVPSVAGLILASEVVKDLTKNENN
ncbi:MAG: tRNA threonylcarbamoyladenosine dehydratase [Clostridia bacterium]